MRVNLSALLGLPENRIRVQYWEGASTFGNSPARFDAGEAAAVMSQLAGAPVRLQFMRWDEHGWDNYGPAILSDMRGGVDSAGNLVALDYTAYGIPSLSMRSDATTQNAGIPLAPYGPRPGRHDQLGHPVRDPEPPRQREVDAALGHVLQDLGAARAALPADLLRLRAARRRARARRADRSLRVPAAEHRDGAGERRLRPVARRARPPPRGSPAGSRASPPRVSRRRTSSRAAGSRSAASPARRPPWWPTSR